MWDPPVSITSSRRFVLPTALDTVTQLEQNWFEDARPQSNSDERYSAKLNLDYKINDKRNMLLVLQYQSDFANLNVQSSERLSSSLQLVQALPKSTTLTIELIDFLATPTTETIVVRDDYESVTERREELRGLRIALARRF